MSKECSVIFFDQNLIDFLHYINNDKIKHVIHFATHMVHILKPLRHINQSKHLNSCLSYEPNNEKAYFLHM